MFTNYLKVAIRNILRNKAYSFINIAGLAVGMASFIAIALYVQDEMSYDKYNVHSDKIVRAVVHGVLNGREMSLAYSPAPMWRAVCQELPDVVTATRLYKGGFPVIRYEEKTFSEERFAWADSTFFDVFSLPLIEGEAKTALAQPNSVVITQSTALRYFGNADPMGKILNMDSRNNYRVTGVMKDVPSNSHFHFDFLGSLSTIEFGRTTTWLSNSFYTYILLRDGTDPGRFAKEFDRVTMKYIEPQIKEVTGVSLEDFRKAGNSYGYVLQPLTSIHLNSHLDYEFESNSNISYVYVFTAIAIAILLIACINFINLATARSERRAKEIGIRKALGSNRSRLATQFLIEAIGMSVAAMVIAIGLLEIVLPLFNELAGKNIHLNVLSDPLTLLLLVVVTLFVGLLAGSYPAFYMSAFEAVQVLKGDSHKGSRKAVVRSGLVIAQFAVSIALFIGTFVIQAQLQYIHSKNLGFDKEQVIIIKRADDLFGQLQSFKHELSARPNVISLTNSDGIPGDQRGDSGFRLSGTPVEQIEDLRVLRADYDFARTYKLGLIEGRFFSEDHPSDSSAVVLNEAAVRAFGIKDVLGRYLMDPGRAGAAQQRSFEIVGVVKDFNFESLHDPVRPLAIVLGRSGFAGKYVSVRVAPGDFPSTLSSFENIWKKYAGNEGFDFSFLDAHLQQQYRDDQRTGNIARTFSVLAIFIACLGLLGLAAFITEQRTKEIGISKVLGASVPAIVMLLSKEFTKWVLLANIVAWPLAYAVMNTWLQGFAYRIEMGVGIFISSGVLALVFALLTVSSHAIRAASANPVEALRYE